MYFITRINFPVSPTDLVICRKCALHAAQQTFFGSRLISAPILP